VFRRAVDENHPGVAVEPGAAGDQLRVSARFGHGADDDRRGVAADPCGGGDGRSGVVARGRDSREDHRDARGEAGDAAEERRDVREQARGAGAEPRDAFVEPGAALVEPRALPADRVADGGEACARPGEACARPGEACAGPAGCVARFGECGAGSVAPVAGSVGGDADFVAGSGGLAGSCARSAASRAALGGHRDDSDEHVEVRDERVAGFVDDVAGFVGARAASAESPATREAGCFAAAVSPGRAVCGGGAARAWRESLILSGGRGVVRQMGHTTRYHGPRIPLRAVRTTRCRPGRTGRDHPNTKQHTDRNNERYTMKTEQKNKLVSYTAAEAVLRANPEVANVPGLPAKLAAFSNRIAEIHDLALVQGQPLAVSLAKRDALFASMARLTTKVAGAVMNVARDRRLDELAAAVQFRRSALRHARPPERLWLARRVLGAAHGVPEALAVYGVTADTLADFQARIDAAADGVHMVRTTVTARRAATERLRIMIRETDLMLREELDPLVEQMREEQPQFHADYRAAREVVDVRGSRAPAGAPAELASPSSPPLHLAA